MAKSLDQALRALIKGGESTEQGRVQAAEWVVSSVLDEHAPYLEARASLLAHLNALGESLHVLYRSARAARNAILWRCDAAARVRSDEDYEAFLAAGYDEESQCPARWEANRAARGDAAKAKAAERTSHDPGDALGCLQRALELISRAAQLDARDAAQEVALCGEIVTALKRVSRSRATLAAAKSA